MNPFAIVAVVAGLAALPADIAGRNGAGDYNAFLQRAAIADHVRTNGAGCAALTVRWLGRERRGGADIPSPIIQVSATRDVVVEHVRVSGCGRTQRHNLMVWRLGNGQFSAAPLATGDSLASPALQDAAFSAAARLAVGLTPEPPCPPGRPLAQNLTFGDVALVRPRVGRGPWSERFALRYCGLDRSATVTFTPNRQGQIDWDIRPTWPGAPRRR